MTTATINGVQVQITSAVRGPRGFSNYELWLEAGHEGTLDDYLAFAESELQPIATAVAADRVQTGQDRIATAADRVQTGADRTGTTADRAQTTSDKEATTSDRVQTGQDRTAATAAKVASETAAAATAADRTQTTADRVATGQDKVATTADRVQTGLDRTASSSSAAQAALLAAVKANFNTNALMQAAVGSYANTDYVSVLVDELKTSQRTIYQRQAGAWVYIMSLDGNAALISKTQIVPQVAYTGKYTATAGGVFGNGYSCLNEDPAPFAGYVEKFFCVLKNPVLPTNVTFYVMRPVGAGAYFVAYVSPAVSVTVSRVDTPVEYIPGAIDAVVQAGDLIGCHVAAASGSPMIYGTATGKNLVYSAGLKTAGSTFTPSVTNPNLNFHIGSKIAAFNSLPPANLANQAGGFPFLDADGRMPIRDLPALYGVDTTTPTAAQTVVVNDGGTTVAVSEKSTSVDLMTLVGSGNSNNTSGSMVISWLTAAPGFVADGTLTRVRIPPFAGSTAYAGNVIRAWVVRPVDLAAGSFRIVHYLGEVDASQLGRYHEFRTAVPVKAGDMMGFQGTAALPSSGENASTTGAAVVLVGSSGDTVTPFTDALLSGTRGYNSNALTPYVAEVVRNSPVASPNGALGVVRTDNNGLIPDRVSRVLDAPLVGKKIIVCGTSIEAGGNATVPGKAWVARLAGAFTKSTVVNEGRSSTGITKNSYLGLSNTAAEAVASQPGVSDAAAASYENKIIGKSADLLILGGPVNDTAYAVGTINSTDRTTLYGAYNYVIQAYFADRPSGRLLLMTTLSAYQINQTKITELDAFAAAIRALGQKYRCPVVDLVNEGGINSYNIAAYTDGSLLHPLDNGHEIMYRAVAKAIQRMF